MSGNMEKLCKIRDVQRSIIAFEQRFVKRHGICLNEGMLLCSLHQSERLSSGELGELLGLTPSNTSKGLITRILGTTDKRQMYFALTEKGREKIASICCEEVEIPEFLNEIIAS